MGDGIEGLASSSYEQCHTMKQSAHWLNLFRVCSSLISSCSHKHNSQKQFEEERLCLAYTSRYNPSLSDI